MSKSWRLTILFSILFGGLAACRYLPSSYEIPRLVTAEPSPTPALCTTWPEGMKVRVAPRANSSISLELEGFQPGESLIFLFTGEIPGKSSARLEVQSTAGVGTDGRFTETISLYTTPQINQWQGKVIHAHGAACFEITLPLSASPIELPGTATAVPEVTAVPPTTNLITQELTAVPTEQPNSPPQSDLSLTFAYPPPPPQPTSPYPGPTPNPSATKRIPPTPTPTVVVNPVENCDLSPSFSHCGGSQLTGKLAYFPTNGQLTVLDFDAETIWVSSQVALQDVDWSPAGDRLLVHDDIFRETYFYHQEGMLLHSEISGWVEWGTTDNHIRAGANLWNENYSISAYIDRSQPQQAMAQFDFYDGTGRKEWPLQDFEVYQGSPAFWEWVPQTEWILVGYGMGGVGTTTTTGYRLMALNARSGEMRDSGIWTRPEHIDWHPSETGLLVATDFAKSEIGRIGTLVAWQILEDRVTYLTEPNHYARSPVWSPDGRYIAYSDYDATWQNHLAVLDMETGLVTTRANQADFPAWSQDGMIIFYLEMGERRDSALIKAIGRDDGESLTVAEGRFPSCPGICLPRTTFDYTHASPSTFYVVPDRLPMTMRYKNFVLGLDLTLTWPVLPEKLVVHEPNYLSGFYGFYLSERESGANVLSIEWLYQSTPEQLETIVQQTIDSFPELAVNHETITINGIEGVMLWPLPGTDETTQIFLVANERLYQLIFWSAPLDAQARELLDSLRFIEPTQSLESLNLPPTR